MKSRVHVGATRAGARIASGIRQRSDQGHGGITMTRHERFAAGE